MISPDVGDLRSVMFTSTISKADVRKVSAKQLHTSIKLSNIR